MIILGPLFFLLAGIIASPQPHRAIANIAPNNSETPCAHPKIELLQKCLKEASAWLRAHPLKCEHETMWNFNSPKKGEMSELDEETTVDICPHTTKGANRTLEVDPIIYGQGTAISRDPGSVKCECREVLSLASALVEESDVPVYSYQYCPRKSSSLRLQLRTLLTFIAHEGQNFCVNGFRVSLGRL